jgi:hypothetical protein
LSEPLPHTQASGAAPARIPLVVAVTGHRRLEARDYPMHRQRIAAFFAALRASYPHTPLRVISALAEGADRLVAAAALEDGYELIVPLPLEPAEYERDFPESVPEFRELLARVPPENVFVVGAGDAGSEGERQDSAWRDRRYRATDEHVAAQCHILLALWDGADTRAAAGAAVVVRLRLHDASREDGGLLNPDFSGPVYWLHAPRQGSGAEAPREPRWLFPPDSDEALFRTVWSRIERFNSDADNLPRRYKRGEPLIPELDTRPAADRYLGGVYASADALARRFRNMTHAVLRTVIALAVGLALTFEIYAELMPRRELPEIYLGIFVAVTLLYLWQKRVDAQGRYLDYRALAEGLRVQFYWRLGGLPQSASQSYLRKQLDELRWIREALRGANALPPPRAPRVDQVLKYWVHGQAHYFRHRAQWQMRRIHRIEFFSAMCLVFGLLATSGLVFFWEQLGGLGHWRHYLVMIMGFAPIAAALWEAYGERFGLRSQAHQYARFATIFARAEKATSHEGADPSAGARAEELDRTLILELGYEALIENGDWVLLLRERPIALPKG